METRRDRESRCEGASRVERAKRETDHSSLHAWSFVRASTNVGLNHRFRKRWTMCAMDASSVVFEAMASLVALLQISRYSSFVTSPAA